MPPESETAGSLPPIVDSDFSTTRAGQLCAGFDWSGFVRGYLPFIHGIATALVPENPSSAENVSIAVFELFKRRVQRMRRRALVAAWLFQTTLIAAKRERRRLQLSNRLTTDAQKILRRFIRLPAKLQNTVLLVSFLQVPIAGASSALRKSERRIDRWNRKGVAKLQKISTEAPAIIRSLALTPSEALSNRVLIPEAREASPLVRQTVWGWRWLLLRAFFKRVLATVGAAVCALAVLAGTFAFLATHGYLTSFFITMGQRGITKEFPEMLIPPRPWPVTEADRAFARTTPPNSADELFRTTNIWPVTLSFSEQEWKRLKPSRIPPVRNMFQDGRIILRNPKAKRSGLAGALGFEFNWGEARLDFASQDFARVGVRFRGNGTYLNSLYGPKQSLKLDVSKFEKTNVLAGIHELNFLNTVVDYSFLHDTLGQQIFRELGAIGPRAAYTYVTVEIDDGGTKRVEPRGLFVAMENIDSDFAEDRFGTKKAPIFKPVTYDLFVDIGDDWAAYKGVYDLKTKATPEQLQRVVELAKLVSHASDEEFAQRLPEYLDFEEFAGYLAGHVLLSSYDGFLVNGQNYYVYLDPRSNKFGFVSWDQDHAWGDFGHIGTNEQRENASIWEPSIYDFVFLNRVLKVEAFRTVYRQKLENALNTLFTKERLYAEIDRLASRIRPAVAAESDFRLKRFDRAVSDQWEPGPRDGEAEGPKAPIHQIKRFVENRIQSVRDQLDGKSKGERLQGFR